MFKKFLLLAAAVELALATSDDPGTAMAPARKSRRRRFALSETTSWSFEVRLRIRFPVEISSGTSTFDARLPITYSHATNQVSGRNSYGDEYPYYFGHEAERLQVLQNLEGHLGKLGSSFGGVDEKTSQENTHACMLRMLCEQAMTPQHDHGMFGDLMNVLLTPAKVLTGLPKLLAGAASKALGRGHNDWAKNSDYVHAQIDGRVRGNCTRHVVDCRQSMFEVIHNNEVYDGHLAYSQVAHPSHGIKEYHQAAY